MDDKVDEYNNTYHRTIKIKPIDINSSTCITFGVTNIDKDHTVCSCHVTYAFQATL